MVKDWHLEILWASVIVSSIFFEWVHHHLLYLSLITFILFYLSPINIYLYFFRRLIYNYKKHILARVNIWPKKFYKSLTGQNLPNFPYFRLLMNIKVSKRHKKNTSFFFYLLYLNRSYPNPNPLQYLSFNKKKSFHLTCYHLRVLDQTPSSGLSNSASNLVYTL